MPTLNPRLNVTLEPTTVELLVLLAKDEHKSVSGIAKELILEALERREDKALSVLADTRDDKPSKRVSHEDAWK